jgi:hypothetical protein
MKKYTVRFAHLKERPRWNIGDKIKFKEKIGIEGSTGKSTGSHCHIDLVGGEKAELYHLKDINNTQDEIAQLNYFLYDNSLYDGHFTITTYYGEPKYFKDHKKVHTGYDVVGLKKNIFWPRSYEGRVTAVFNHPAGYGWVIYFVFEVPDD